MTGTSDVTTLTDMYTENNVGLTFHRLAPFSAKVNFSGART